MSRELSHRLYLERVVGSGLRAFSDAERAWALITDLAAFDDRLRSLDADRRQDVISSLEVYQDQFAPIHVIPGSVVLLNLFQGLPERARGTSAFSRRIVVTRVVLRLLRSSKEPEAREEAVQQILPQLTSLSAKLLLVTTVGHREGIGHGLVSEATAAKLEKDWSAEVRLATAESLAEECEPLQCLLQAKRWADPAGPPFGIADSPHLTLALLRSARSDMSIQGLGSRAVRRSLILAWDALIYLYGGEAALRLGIAKLKSAQPTDVDDLLALVDKYLSGWRPSGFGDD